MSDLEVYYASDHRGHERLWKILNYAQIYREFLTKDECQFAIDYYDHVRDLINNRTLHLQENCPWHRLNFRYGWPSVRGTQAEFLAVIIWNFFNTNTKFRLRTSSKEEQELGLDVAVVNPGWQSDYVGQVKELIRGDNPKQIKIKDDYIQYDPSYVDRLILVDIDNLILYHFDYQEFLDHYEICPKYNHGFIDDDFNKMKHFHKFKLSRFKDTDFLRKA